MSKRERKFRTWNKDTQVFEYFTLNNEFDCHVGWLENKIISDYIGLKDKNGTEIYEGDIIEFMANYTSKPAGWMKAKIVIDVYGLRLHSENGFVYDAEEETDEFPYLKCKVVGNIFQDPELLTS